MGRKLIFSTCTQGSPGLMTLGCIRRGVGFVGRIGHKGVAAQRANQKLVAERPGQPREQGNVERLDAVDFEAIEILRIIGKRHARALRRTQPLVLLAEGEYVVQVLVGEIRFKKAPLGSGRRSVPGEWWSGCTEWSWDRRAVCSK